MSHASPRLQRFAKLLLNHETLSHEATGADLAATFRATDHLRPHLVALMGTSGFRAMCSRALASASAENSRLSLIHVKDDGTLSGLDTIRSQLEPAELQECEANLLAHLLTLIEAFIGVALTAAIVSQAWPKISPADMDFGNGDAK